jgi:ParB family chromosome partitioning protein
MLAERPAWRDTSAVLPRHLRTPDNHEASETAVAEPTHWAVLLVEDTEPVDTVTAEPVDEQTSTGAPNTIRSANLPRALGTPTR